MDYLVHVFVFVGIYAILAISLDLLVGQAGLLSIAHAGFYGLGAYASAILAVKAGIPVILAMAAATALGCIVSLFVSMASARLNEHFVLATFAFQMIVFALLNNWTRITRGPLGISGIPNLQIGSWLLDSAPGFCLFAGVVVVLVFSLVGLMTASPFGRVLRAIREDDDFAQALGKNIHWFKIIILAISAGIASLAGAMYAHYITFIDPTSFTVAESILMLSMVIIGGPGSRWGPLVGAVVMVSLPEGLRFIGFPSSIAANLRQITYGALLVIMMMFKPRGLVGKYGFGR